MVEGKMAWDKVPWTVWADNGLLVILCRGSIKGTGVMYVCPQVPTGLSFLLWYKFNSWEFEEGNSGHCCLPWDGDTDFKKVRDFR